MAPASDPLGVPVTQESVHGTWEHRRPRRERTGPPLYEQALRRIEAMAMAAPLGHTDPFPPESELVARLGVSRGTLRRATEELVRQGLLRIEPGRGTFVEESERVRRTVWSELATVARPDSRFDVDLRRFIPDFVGRERCDRRLLHLPAYQSARTVFVAPDNSLEQFRAQALRDGKQLLVPTYGLARGLVALTSEGVPTTAIDLAATLDGMERFGRRLDLPSLLTVGRIDLMVTGAVAVTTGGVHVDAGHGYLAAEWRLLAECGLVDADTTPMVASVHGCQVLEAELRPGEAAVTVDRIVTPSRTITCRRQYPRPGGLGPVDAFSLESEGIGPYLVELARRRSQEPRRRSQEPRQRGQEPRQRSQEHSAGRRHMASRALRTAGPSQPAGSSDSDGKGRS